MSKLWKVEQNRLQAIDNKNLLNEPMLEQWIVDNPAILGLDLLIIGRQIKKFGGILDLLAINKTGDLIVIELKRGKTPREVIAQILDYASWVCKLTTKEIHEIAYDYNDQPLDVLYKEHFSDTLPENLNASHSMLIIASEFDQSSKRIVEYLAEEHDININTAFFEAFGNAQNSYLVADWLMDRQQVQERADNKMKAPWEGYYFVNSGTESGYRSWNDMRKYGFISAGGNRRYYLALSNLPVGSPIFAYSNGTGYVGFGYVTHTVTALKKIFDDRKDSMESIALEKPIVLESYQEGNQESEHAIGIEWKKTFSLQEAKRFVGAFANQNVVCKLRDQATIDFLKAEFLI